MNPDEQPIEESTAVDPEEQTLRDYLLDNGIRVQKGMVFETRAALDLLKEQGQELLQFRDKEAERQAAEDNGSANIMELARLIGVYASSLTALEVAPDLVRTLVRDYANVTLQAYYGLKGGKE